MRYPSFILVSIAILILPSFSGAQIIFERCYGGTDYDWGTSVQETQDGAYIIAGWTRSFGAGSKDVYLIKTDSLGDTVWTKTYGGTFDDGGRSVQETQDGGYIIAGGTWSFGADSGDVYLLKKDSLGNVAGVKEEEKDLRYKTSVIRLTTFPNPFFSEVRIQISDIRRQKSENREHNLLRIYDVSGRVVRHFILYPSSFILGTTWDGRDAEGKVVPPGIYFLKLNGGEYTKTQKIIKIK